MVTKIIALGLSLCVAMPSFAQVKIGADEVFPERTLAETLVTVEDLSRFAEAAKASGLMEDLRAAGPMTLIAPRNRAFPAKDPDAPEQADLLAEETGEAFADQLACHVIPQKLDLAALSTEGETKIETLGSCEITVKDGAIFGPDGTIIRLTATNMEQENGILHVTDQLIDRPD